MEKEPVEKGKLLVNRLVILDTVFYGIIIGSLSLINFIFVTYIAGNGTAHTVECNHTLNEDCRHIFRGRGTCFGTMTLLLLIHAYNCKNLALSLTKMTIMDNMALFGSVVFGACTLVPTFYIPVVYNKVFYQAPIDWEWGLILGAAVLFLLASEMYKAYVRPRVVRGQLAAVHQRRSSRAMPVGVVESGGRPFVVVSHL